MQKLLVILIFLSLGFHSLMKVGMIAWYEVNKDYVTEVLCINKDKPQLQCKGKCYLKKQLNKIDNTTNTDNTKAPAPNERLQPLEFITSQVTQFNTQTIHTTPINHTAYCFSWYRHKYISSILRPPIV